jgi:hypothetical protein
MPSLGGNADVDGINGMIRTGCRSSGGLGGGEGARGTCKFGMTTVEQSDEQIDSVVHDVVNGSSPFWSAAASSAVVITTADG